MFTENTAAFLADFTVPASYVAASISIWTLDESLTWDSLNRFDGSGPSLTYTAQVFFDEPEAEVIGGRALSTNYLITYRTTDLPGLVNGMSITVNGIVYEVIDARTVDDGVFSRATLER